MKIKIVWLAMFAPFLLAGCCTHGNSGTIVITKTLEPVTVTISAKMDYGNGALKPVDNFSAFLKTPSGATTPTNDTNGIVTININQVEYNTGTEIIVQGSNPVFYTTTNLPSILTNLQFNVILESTNSQPVGK